MPRFINTLICLSFLNAAIAAEEVRWYPFTPKNTVSEGSPLDMREWHTIPLKRPAIKGDRLVSGRDEIVFWGTNNQYGALFPDKQDAEKKAAFYAKWGVNLLRLHKFGSHSWAGIYQTNSTLALDKQKTDRFDYFVSQLRKHGISYTFSQNFKFFIGPQDGQNIPGFNEFKKGRNSYYGHVFLSKEIQDLYIRKVVEFIKRKNPYTGLYYYQDPALANVELLNETNAYWYTMMQVANSSPTLKKNFATRFSAWLKNKYQSNDKFKSAWKGSINFNRHCYPGEDLNKNNIFPVGNPYIFSNDMTAHSQRLLDTAEFLHDVQNDFYGRFIKAVRETGYDGPFITSNWQAGDGVAHFYNLKSDAQFGIVDRHNYFGGQKDDNWQTRAGKLDNASMLSAPGSGYFSSAFQQVADRPFMLSEFNHRHPNEWAAEGLPIIGAYGMGLHGWDLSTIFGGINQARFSTSMSERRQDFTIPTVWCLFPAISRQVLRRDVKKGDVVSTRTITSKQLRTNTLDFKETVKQQHDVKVVTSDKVPSAALAIGPVLVDFNEKSRPVDQVHASLTNGKYISNTGELAWRPGANSQDGHIEINTDGTQAAVGFFRDYPVDLKNVQISTQTRFAVIYVTALSPDKTIENDDELLITVVARAQDRDAQWSADRNTLIRMGKGPIEMEAVTAQITFKKPMINAVVTLLDHDGMPTKRTVTFDGRTLGINGSEHKTMFYHIKR